MSTATTTQATPTMSANDIAAHRAASHVRTVLVPVQDSPKPLTAPAARRRFIAQRGW